MTAESYDDVYVYERIEIPYDHDPTIELNEWGRKGYRVVESRVRNNSTVYLMECKLEVLA